MSLFRQLTPVKIVLLAATLVGVFFVVYSPHFSYPFPFHIDEWHHIDQSILLGSYGDYFDRLRVDLEARPNSFEIGFHLFLLLLSLIVNVPTTLQFMPGLWAVLTASVLFYTTYKLTRGNFLAAWLAIIFFASIKSNVNLTGLWFFTPLTFAAPFLFLYMYLFSEGLLRQDKRMVLGSLAIMVFLIPTHSVSLLFALPALTMYGLFYWRYILSEWKFFWIFLVIPVAGFIFFKDALGLAWGEAFVHFAQGIQFPYGWGVLELNNSLFEVYTLVGVVFAFAGVVLITMKPERWRFLLYLLWPLNAFILIVLFRATGISFLAPFQRNLYYLALGLPVLSGVGAAHLITFTSEQFKRFLSSAKDIEYITKVLTVGVVMVTVLFSFVSYYEVPAGLELYQPINKADYAALQFLAQQPPGHVLASPFVSTAVFSVSGMRPLATVFFDSQFRGITEQFFVVDCEQKNALLQGVEERLYIISQRALTCGWNTIYNDDDYIYQIN